MLGDHIILAFLWILFGVFHSVLADNSVKQKLTRHSKRFAKNYRFFYTVFAFATFGYVVYFQIKTDSYLLFQQNIVTKIGGIISGSAGLIIMIICIKKYFLSLSGLKSLFAETTVANELRIDGIHRYVRHPLYLGTFLFIWGTWLIFPLVSFGITNVVITLYTLIGIHFEERKLVEEFGQSYISYSRQVPKIIPFSNNI